jgi:hypothetical protein
MYVSVEGPTCQRQTIYLELLANGLHLSTPGQSFCVKVLFYFILNHNLNFKLVCCPICLDLFV